MPILSQHFYLETTGKSQFMILTRMPISPDHSSIHKMMETVGQVKLSLSKKVESSRDGFGHSFNQLNPAQ